MLKIEENLAIKGFASAEQKSARFLLNNYEITTKNRQYLN